MPKRSIDGLRWLREKVVGTEKRRRSREPADRVPVDLGNPDVFVVRVLHLGVRFEFAIADDDAKAVLQANAEAGKIAGRADDAEAESPLRIGVVKVGGDYWCGHGCRPN